MKQHRLHLFLIVSAILSTVMLQAADRIAVIDLEKVFREYYKSRIAEDAIRKQAEVYRSYLTRLNARYETLRLKEQRARANSQNIALSAAELEKAEAALNEAVRELSAQKAEIELYMKERGDDMRKLESRKRAEIMEDIRKEIRRRSQAEGFNFVLDISGKTTNDQPAVLQYPVSADITAAVIRELNRVASVQPKPEAQTDAAPAKNPEAPAQKDQQSKDLQKKQGRRS